MQALVDTILRPVRWFERLQEGVQDRLVGLVLAVPTGSVLLTALLLTPDPSGMGTHRQLGLSGCAVLTLTGLPCPMCGMTTTFTHLAHLEVIQGTINQPFGLALFTATVISFVVGTIDVIRPMGAWRKALEVIERHELAIAIGLLGGMFAGWAYKIAMVKNYLPWMP